MQEKGWSLYHFEVFLICIFLGSGFLEEVKCKPFIYYMIPATSEEKALFCPEVYLSLNIVSVHFCLSHP